MTRTLISAGLVAAFGLSGNAFAQAISPADAAAAPTQIFLSGATAPATIVRNVVKATMCPSGFAEYNNSTRFYAIACNSSVTGGNAVFYYTSLGSNFGVQPVLYNGTGVATPKLKLSSCPTQASATNQSCTGITTAAESTIPDVGVSDIAPSGFVGANVPTAAVLDREFNSTFGGNFAAYSDLYSALQQDATTSETDVITPINGVVFNVAMSNPLATALGGSANSIPFGIGSTQSLPSTVIRAIMKGQFATGSLALQAIGIDPTTVTTGTKFAVCTRPATSGTKAWANLFFLGSGTTPRAENAVVGTAGAWKGSTTQTANTTRSIAFVENLGSSDVRTCLIQASAQGIPAIGIISVEAANKPLAVNGTAVNNYSFGRIDGVYADNAAADDRVNVRSGLYTYVGEATFNQRATLAAGPQSIITAITNELNSSTVCSSAGSVTQPTGSNTTGTSCETKWSRGGIPTALPYTISGE
jgi:hypothetical protein